jgi:nitroimidazol reductase NimA-like FMN-containing flavoprotein (pyridoxamine 5'-phosphate oxidase superfamily)
VERLDLPKGYGQAKTALDWNVVRGRLEEAMNYWLATTRSDGRPHAVPSDGIWLDDAWYFGGSHDTVHMRNVERNPKASLHLGDGTWAVIVEGTCAFFHPDAAQAQTIAAAGAKYSAYGYAPTPGSYADGVWCLRAERAVAWTAFPTDATRFRFG